MTADIIAFSPRPSRFTPELWDEIEPVDQEWIVRGLLPARGLAFLVGPSGTGKSFIALDILARIASGWPALERRTRHVGVAYVASEGPDGMRKRIKAWRTVHGGPANFQLISQAVDLRDDEAVADLTATLGEIAAHMATNGRTPLGIVAVDTLAASMPGGNENDGADMSEVIWRLQALSRQLGLLVLMIAHFGKDEARGIRGWSGQTGAADLILTVQSDKEEPRLSIVTAAKVKDGEHGDRFAFRLAQVILGEDKEGEEITSATPVYEAAPGARRTPRALNTAEELALKAVKLVNDHGPHHPAPAAPGVPRSVVSLARSDVKSRAMGCGFAAPEESANTISARFSRALQGLAAKGRVRLEGDWVWLL